MRSSLLRVRSMGINWFIDGLIDGGCECFVVLFRFDNGWLVAGEFFFWAFLTRSFFCLFFSIWNRSEGGFWLWSWFAFVWLMLFYFTYCLRCTFLLKTFFFFLSTFTSTEIPVGQDTGIVGFLQPPSPTLAYGCFSCLERDYALQPSDPTFSPQPSQSKHPGTPTVSQYGTVR